MTTTEEKVASLETEIRHINQNLVRLESKIDKLSDMDIRELRNDIKNQSKIMVTTAIAFATVMVGGFVGIVVSILTVVKPG